MVINALKAEINLPSYERYEIVATFQLFVDAVQFNCFLSLANGIGHSCKIKIISYRLFASKFEKNSSHRREETRKSLRSL